MNWFVSALALGAATLLVGCESVRYVKSELSGTAKPEGGTQEVVSPSRTYNATPQVLRRAVLAVLGEQGYVYEDASSTGAIKTEPKSLTDTSKFGFAGATYHAKLFITFDGSVVTYRAKFDKKSNITMPELNVEFPEKENELRKDFFAALDKRLTTGSSDQLQGATPPPSTPPQRPTSSVDRAGSGPLNTQRPEISGLAAV